ncbi:MAG: hypothetical protein AAFQ36_09355 [Pseudomonadota bacterium]
MADDFEWSPWIYHDDSGWPQGVEPDEVVWPQVGRDLLSPMPAINLSWRCPGDPVTRYRRREWRPPVDAAEKELEHIY